jgi:hypothetical protein
LRLSAVDIVILFCYPAALNPEAHPCGLKAFCPFAAA